MGTVSNNYIRIGIVCDKVATILTQKVNLETSKIFIIYTNNACIYTNF